MPDRAAGARGVRRGAGAGDGSDTCLETEFKAKLVTGTKSEFRLDNGTGATVTCEASTTSGTTPSNTIQCLAPKYNNNPHSTTNTSEKAGGSVLANLVKPTFTTCTSPATTTTVTTSETNGKWSLDWNVLNSEAAPWTTAAIGVPKAGAMITLEASGFKCALTVDPETAQGVVGYWENGTSTTESKLYINAQVFFAATAATKTECETDFGITNSGEPGSVPCHLHDRRRGKRRYHREMVVGDS